MKEEKDNEKLFFYCCDNTNTFIFSLYWLNNLQWETSKMPQDRLL